VSAVAVVACVVLLYMLWHVTRTQHVDQDEPADAVATAETAAEVAQAMSRVSNAAILASIALTHLQFSMFVWELPFDLPPVLGSISAWAASVFSFDIGQLSSPECQSSSTDPKTVFVGKLALLHVAYLAANCLLWMVPKVTGHRHRLHAVNAMTALYTIAVTALVKCCLRAVDCTWQPALDRYTLDAMPDMFCWEDDSTFWQGAIVALLALVVYSVIIPINLLRRLRQAGRDGALVDPEFLEANGWLLLKYRPDCYWFEMVLLAYKLVWTASSVLLDSEQRAWLLIAIQGGATLVLLVVVVVLRPFQDGTTAADPEHSNDHEHTGWTAADIVQVLTLVSLLGNYAVSMACLSLDGACESDSVVELVAAVAQLAILLVPVTAMIVLYRRERKATKQVDDLEGDAATERSLDVDNPMLDDNESSADDEVSYVVNPVTVDPSTITQTDTPPIKTMIVIANSTVQHGPSLDSAKVGKIDAGMTVDVFEECSRVGHHRCRIGPNEWVSAVTSKGHIIARITAYHSKANEPCIKQMIVMDFATVRQGANLDSVKVGEIQPRLTIAVFEECGMDGHQRCRIGPDEWISAVTARGHVIARNVADNTSLHSARQTNHVSSK
jgi:hypothetical protein